MNKKAPQLFWNSDKIIEEFSNASPQGYWIDFFNQIENKKERTVLDLGCGAGRYTEVLAKLGFKVYAIDYHSAMVESTKLRVKVHKNVKLVIKANMLKLPFKKDFFDLILSNGVFHNSEKVGDIKKALLEAKRVLKKEGILCLNMFYDGGNNSQIKRVGIRVFETKDGLYMALMKKNDLLNQIIKTGFKKIGRLSTYIRKMDVGKRDVFRGIFVKY